MESDLQIAQRAKLEPIHEITGRLGLLDSEVEPYGRYKAKVRLESISRLGDGKFGKYIVVTGINPTPLGEGKTVTTTRSGAAGSTPASPATRCASARHSTGRHGPARVRAT